MRLKQKHPAPEEFLPLTPAIAHILLAVADDDRHGYAIMQEVERMTDGGVRMGPGTLYGTLKRMLAAGLVEEADAPPEPSQAGCRSPRRSEEANEAERAAKSERSGVSQAGCRGPRRSENDDRRRYYRSTALGRAVLEAETARMSALVSAARAKRVRAR
jgi:DNA-binding PadR family transcriptional regulator